MWPIFWLGCILVLDWIPMDVIAVVDQIALVSDYMIPETVLPETERRWNIVSPFEVQGIVAFDAVQDSGKITALFIYAHQPMEMIWEYDVGQEAKKVYVLDSLQSLPEKLQVRVRFEVRDAVAGDSCDKDYGIRDVVPSEVRHYVLFRRLWKAALRFVFHQQRPR